MYDFETARNEQSKKVDKKRHNMETENCTWCGTKLTSDTRATCGIHPVTNRICKRCDSLRSTILSRIKYSSKIAQYVAAAESREASKREERARQQSAKPVQEKLPIPTEPQARAAMTPEDIAKVVAAVMNELLK